MSERRPKREGPAFSVNAGGKNYEFSPGNSQLFLYSKAPQFDHFRRHDGSIFRQQLEGFDSFAMFAENNGFYVNTENAYPLGDVYEVYKARFGEPPLPEFNEITRRNERKIQFAIFAMDHMETVEDLF